MKEQFFAKNKNELKNEIPSEEKVTPKTIEKKSPQEKTREKLLNLLQQENILNIENGFHVFDFEKFFQKNFFHSQRNREESNKFLPKKRLTPRFFFETLSDFKMISKKDFEKTEEKKEQPQEKSLFNIPESSEEAFNLDTIKNKAYYLNLWDITESRKDYYKGGLIMWKKPIIAKNGDEIDLVEFVLATKIFRKFKGQRNKNGDLEVFSPQENKMTKISADWGRKNCPIACSQKKYDNTSFWSAPRKSLTERGKTLLAKKILKLEDFEIQTSQIDNASEKSGEIFRKEFSVNEKRPTAMIHGVRYFIGRKKFIFNGEKIPTEKIKIIVLDKDTAGIVEKNQNREILRFTFPLLNEQEKEEKRKKIEEKSNKKLTLSQISAQTLVGKKELESRINPWKITDENKPKSNETKEEYAQRISQISDMSFIKKVGQDFSLETQIGIHNLTWKEQTWLSSAAFELRDNYPKLIKFGKKYGLSGLKTFLSCEIEQEMGEKILALGEKLEPQAVNIIFQKYSEIVDNTHNLSQAIANHFKKNEDISQEDLNQINEMILFKGKNLLSRFYDKLETEKEISPLEIFETLQKIKEDCVLFLAIFKNFSKNNPEASFDDFKGLSFETKKGIDFKNKKEDVSKMIAIAKENYQEDLPLQNLVIESLKEGLEKENSEFFTLRHNEEIIAFLRFDDEGDHFYAGSFNIDPNYRGNAIGETMIRKAFDKKAKQKPLLGITDPDKTVCNKYVEDAGFIISGIDRTKSEDKEVLGVEIWRDDLENQQYFFRSSQKDIRSFYEKQQQEKLSRTQILKNKKPFIISFDKSSEMENFLNISEKLIQKHGYVITRYSKHPDDQQRMLVAFERSRI